MDLALIRGDDRTIDLPLVPADSTWAAFTAKRGASDPDEAALLRKDSGPGGGITIDGSGAHVAIAAADTVALVAPILLVWDLEDRSPAGLATTRYQGTLALSADITRNPGNPPGSGS